MTSLTEVLTKTRRKRARKAHVTEEVTQAASFAELASEAHLDASNGVDTDVITTLKEEESPIAQAAPVEPPKKASVAPAPQNHAEFLICVKNGLIACRRSPCGVKAYPIGGTLGSLTLEQLADRQGWKVTKGNEIHFELLDGKRVAWFDGDAIQLLRHGSRSIWADRGHVERSDHLHDDVLEKVFENG